MARPDARVIACGALLVALVLAGGASRDVSAASAKKPAAVPGELIVGFKSGVSDSQQAAALASAGAKKKKAFKQIHANLVGASENKLAKVTKVLESDPRVRYVEPNYVVTTAAVPNDPRFNELWGMNNTGQTGGTADADIDAPEAWNLETGSSNVVVAVVDTGVDFSHPDLAQQQWVNPGENCGSSDPNNVSCAQRTDGVDNDGDGYVDDWRGWDFINHDNDPFDDNNHGTHVSGTIGAVGNNGVGVAGVDWNVRIMALKFLSSAGSGSTADAITATLYAADHGAKVASNSWGGAPFDQGLVDAIDYGATHGMLFVAAAGNDSSNSDTTPAYPASFPSDDIVSVAATDSNDNLASFSNYGATTVDLAAPGVGVLSTTPGNTYSSFSGTSMATPHVSGAAALVLAHFPNATAYGIKALLMSSVDTKASLTGRMVSNGRLNIFNAVSCSNAPKVLLSAPTNGFTVGIGDTIPITVLGANCASPAGLPNVSVTVNGAPVAMSSASPDNALYTGNYVVTAAGGLTVAASVTVNGSTSTKTATGTAVQNYSCTNVADTWVDARPGGKVPGGASDSDDGFTALNVSFPFTYYGQTYSTAYVSSNGFLTLGSNVDANAYANTGIPNTATPNGVIAPFWDDLNPAAGGDVYAGVGGSAPNRVLYVEWFDVQRFNLSPTGTATFEVSLHESTGEVRYHWLDTDFGDSRWNTGASATAGVENAPGTIGRQISFNQPLLTNDRAVSCSPTTNPPPTAPSITTTSLPDATNTQAYSQTLTASGGTPPYTWSVASGALPSGLVLDAATGALTGTPTVSPGGFSFTAQVTDAAAQSATKDLLITVADPLVITTTSLPDGTVGQAYSQGVDASGGQTPYAWSVSAGSLPPGLVLSPSTGTISGSPTSSGTFGFTVQAADTGTPARTASKVFSVTVAVPLAITTASLAGGTVGQAYSQGVAATGGTTPYAWSVASGNLPPGLTLGASTGTISGTPTSAGSFSFTVQVDDSGVPARSDAKPLSIAVATSPPSVTTTSLPDATNSTPYSRTLGATGGSTPYTWSLDSGSLPTGLALDPSTGEIAGTPATATGSYAFTVRVTDSFSQFATKSLSIAVADPLVVTTSSLVAGKVGKFYTQTLAATGGKTPYAWSLASGSLPPGLSLNASTGVVSGSPTVAGTYSFTVRATDTGNPARTDTKALSIAVAPKASLAITSWNVPGGRVGSPYSGTVTASGGIGPYTWSISAGALPPGLSLVQGTPTLTISGTPTTVGRYNFTVQVTDTAGGLASHAFSVRIRT